MYGHSEISIEYSLFIIVPLIRNRARMEQTGLIETSALPTLKSSTIFSRPSIHTYKMFQKPGSTFLPTYSWLRINKNLILHSKSDFAENSNHFHIQSQMEYKLSSRWSLDIYGSQNLDTRRYRGLPSEVEPTKLGSNVVFKINKNWKIKTGMQYQYNAIRKRWEWIPQVSVSYEW